MFNTINNNIPSDNILESADSKNNNLTPAKQQKIIGDIDELIFPDDEPYYISER